GIVQMESGGGTLFPPWRESQQDPFAISLINGGNHTVLPRPPERVLAALLHAIQYNGAPRLWAIPPQTMTSRYSTAMLTLLGAPALSAFRRQKLLTSLQQVDTGVKAVTA